MTEHFNIEPGSFVHKLGINKSDEWIRTMVDRCFELFKENPEDFSSLLAEAPATISKAFFIIGFMKGVCFSEQTSELNSVMNGQKGKQT